MPATAHGSAVFSMQRKHNTLHQDFSETMIGTTILEYMTKELHFHRML